MSIKVSLDVNSNRNLNEFWDSKNTSLDIFFKSLNLSRVRGIVIINGLSKTEFNYTKLIKELLKRDVLLHVTNTVFNEINKDGLIEDNQFKWAGCGLSDFCDFMEVAPIINIGEKIHSKITNFYSELANIISIQLQDLPIAVVSEIDNIKLEELFKITFKTILEPLEVTDMLDKHIHDKRLNLQWFDRFHCDVTMFS